MSDFDWQSFFLNAPKPRVRVAWSIFDDPEEVEKSFEPSKDKAEKKPTQEAPAETPKSQPAQDKKPDQGKWDKFLELFYEGGKKKVKNPNPKTNKKYPEVQVSTALKDQSYAAKVHKEYEAWLQQGGDEKPAEKPKKTVLPSVKDLEKLGPLELQHVLSELAEQWTGTKKQEELHEEVLKRLHGDEYEEHGDYLLRKSLEDFIQKFKEKEADAGEQGNYNSEQWYGALVDDLKEKIKDLPAEKKTKKPAPVLGDTLDEWDDLQDGLFVQSGELMGQISSVGLDSFQYKSLLPNGKWAPEQSVTKDQFEKALQNKSYKVMGDPLEEVPEGAELVSGFDVTPGDTVWLDGKSHKVLKVEPDEDKHGNHFKLKGKKEWINMHDVDRLMGGANNFVYMKSSEASDLFEKGDKVYYEGEEVEILDTKKDSYGKQQVKFKEGDMETWVSADSVSDDAPEGPKVVEVGEKVTKPGHLEVGDFIETKHEGEDEPYVGKITEVHEDDAVLGPGVYIQDFNMETGKLTGEPWWLEADKLENEGESKKIGAPKVKKALSGKAVTDLKKLKPGDVLRTHKYSDGKLTTSIVAGVEEGKGVHLNVMNAKTGKVIGSKFIAFDGWDDKYQLSRLPMSKVPKKLKDQSKYMAKSPSTPAKPEVEKELEKDEKEVAEAPVEAETEAATTKLKTTKVDPTKWKLKTVNIPWEDIKKDDAIHTKDYGPQRVVDTTATKVRLESGVLVGKTQLKKSGKNFVVSRGDKPQKETAPKAPERPTGKPVTEPSQVEEGDVIEYEHNGTTYRGLVVSWDTPDEKFRVRIIYPPSHVEKYESYNETTGEKDYKTPSFDQAKINKRKPRILTKEEMKGYDQKTDAYVKKLKEIDEKYAQDVAEYEAAMEGKSEATTGPLKNVKAPSSWSTGSSIARDADRFFSQYKDFLGDKIKNNIDSWSTSKQYFSGPADTWDELSEGQKKLVTSAHKAAPEFRKLLTPEEGAAWKDALSSWQGSSGAYEAHKLMGGLENLGVEGNAKKWETSNVQHYREIGRKNEALQRAISKAMAYSQLVYDMLGVKEVPLYRGTKTKGVKGAKQGQKIKTNTARELASFSISPQVAYGFNAHEGGVVKYKVPVGRLFISPVTYASLSTAISPYSENEYVVAGQDGMEGKVMPKDQYSYDAKKMKLASYERRNLFDLPYEDDVVIIEFTPEDDDWLRSPVKDEWWPAYCHGYDQWEEENMPRFAGILRLARQNESFRRALLQEMRPKKASFTIFDDPSKVEKESASEESPDESSEAYHSDDSGFMEWYHSNYEDGKKKVKNPNPKTNKKYPEVQADTAMKDAPFAKAVHEAYERQKEQAEEKPATKKNEGPLNIDEDFKKVGPQAGSNPGGLYEAEDGTRYYVKTPKTEDHGRNEILAAKLYELADVAVPELTTATRDGKFSVASKIVPGLEQNSSKLRKGKVPGVAEGMAVDAWLANWDVIGLDYDNLLIDKDGKAMRVDTGGALRYRAMGKPKGGAFGDKVTEMDVFTDPSRKAGGVLGNATDEQIVESIDRVLNIPEDKIRGLVDEWGPKDEGDKEELYETLMARREDLKKQRKNYADTSKSAARRVAKKALARKRAQQEHTMNENKKVAFNLLKLARQNSSFRGELLGELRRLNAPEDFAYDDESQEALLTKLKGGDRVEVTFDAEPKTPARSVVHTVAFDYDPAIRGVELDPEEGEGPRAFLADAEDGDSREGVIYSPNPNSKGYPVIKLKVVRSVLRYDPAPPKIR